MRAILWKKKRAMKQVPPMKTRRTRQTGKRSGRPFLSRSSVPSKPLTKRMVATCSEAKSLPTVVPVYWAPGVEFSQGMNFGSSTRIPFTLRSGKASYRVKNKKLEAGTTYFYRAYARNSAGVNFGSVKRLKVPESEDKGMVERR